MRTKTSTTRKSAAKKSARKASSFLGYNIPETTRLVVIGQNPRRKGSGPHGQYEKMKGGKTVAQYLRAGGKRRWIPGAARRGFIKKTWR